MRLYYRKLMVFEWKQSCSLCSDKRYLCTCVKSENLCICSPFRMRSRCTSICRPEPIASMSNAFPYVVRVKPHGYITHLKMRPNVPLLLRPAPPPFTITNTLVTSTPLMPAAVSTTPPRRPRRRNIHYFQTRCLRKLTHNCYLPQKNTTNLYLYLHARPPPAPDAAITPGIVPYPYPSPTSTSGFNADFCE